MKTLGLTLVTLLVICGMIAGCTSTPVYTDQTKPIEIGVNQQFIIALASNPTTGYQWECAVDNSGTYKQVGQPEYEPPKQAIPGAGGTQKFTFQGVKAGKGSIKFTYRRSWMPPNQPDDKTMTFTITVK